MTVSRFETFFVFLISIVIINRCIQECRDVCITNRRTSKVEVNSKMNVVIMPEVKGQVFVTLFLGTHDHIHMLCKLA